MVCDGVIFSVGSRHSSHSRSHRESRDHSRHKESEKSREQRERDILSFEKIRVSTCLSKSCSIKSSLKISPLSMPLVLLRRFVLHLPHSLVLLLFLADINRVSSKCNFSKMAELMRCAELSKFPPYFHEYFKGSMPHFTPNPIS
jgi:hypothetical protein